MQTAKEYLEIALGGNMQTDSLTQQAWIELMDGYAGQFKTKAENWDKLDEEIGEFYGVEDDYPGSEYYELDDEDDEPNLASIGEVAAIAFGYL